MHMHARSIVHRDVKPANIFVDEDPKGQGYILRLSDFSESKVYIPKKNRKQGEGRVGSPLVEAPEVVR